MKGLRYTKALAISVTAVSLSLAACSTPAEPTVKTVQVLTPVAVSCISKGNDPGQPSAYADEPLPQGPDKAGERYRAIAAANAQRRARLALLEPVLAACR